MSRTEQMVLNPKASGRKNRYDFPTAPHLFRRRLISHLQEQWAIIRTAADWTVLLYLIIPGGLLGGRLYYGFWNGEMPAWTQEVPFMIIPLLLAALIATGGMVLLLQEGDSLFLRQRQSWVKSIMLRGLLYSLAVTALKIAAVFALLLPFIIRGYGLGVAAAVTLLVLSITCSWCVKLLGHIVKVQRQGFRRWLWLIPAVTVPCGIYLRAAMYWNDQPALLLAVAGVYGSVAVGVIRYRLRLRGTFMNDVREDYKQRMRIAGIMLRGVVDKPRPTRYQPWIFRKSQPLLTSKLPESRFSAAGIKALIRNPAHLKLYLTFTGVSMIALGIAPGFMKWGLLIIMASLMAYWLTSFWILFAGDDYIGILPFSKEQKADAGSKAMPILLVPYAVICSAVVSIFLYGWLGLVLFVPAGYFIGVIIARMFSSFRFQR